MAKAGNFVAETVSFFPSEQFLTINAGFAHERGLTRARCANHCY
jgi:hypothetical protein